MHRRVARCLRLRGREERRSMRSFPRGCRVSCPSPRSPPGKNNGKVVLGVRGRVDDPRTSAEGDSRESLEPLPSSRILGKAVRKRVNGITNAAKSSRFPVRNQVWDDFSFREMKGFLLREEFAALECVTVRRDEDLHRGQPLVSLSLSLHR